mmetsp:Transcript_36132/g.62282  ORF Transcript_36132/g.62282 Transcript_36132/m.62282 type:complete len:218 (-) Transcript_36132:3650-4303(-)
MQDEQTQIPQLVRQADLVEQLRDGQQAQAGALHGSLQQVQRAALAFAVADTTCGRRRIIVPCELFRELGMGLLLVGCDVEGVLEVDQALGHVLALGRRGAAGNGLLRTRHGFVKVGDAGADLHVFFRAGQATHQHRSLHELSMTVIVAVEKLRVLGSQIFFNVQGVHRQKHVLVVAQQAVPEQRMEGSVGAAVHCLHNHLVHRRLGDLKGIPVFSRR